MLYNQLVSVMNSESLIFIDVAFVSCFPYYKVFSSVGLVEIVFNMIKCLVRLVCLLRWNLLLLVHYIASFVVVVVVMQLILTCSCYY